MTEILSELDPEDAFRFEIVSNEFRGHKSQWPWIPAGKPEAD